MKEVNSRDFKAEVLNYNGVVLVDFWAEWCGPCRMLAPILSEVSDEVADKAKVVKVNVDEADAIAAEYGIMNIPTLVLFKNGQEIERVVGVRQKAQLVSLIEKNL